MADVRKYAQVAKVDEELGLVMGWAITSTIKGEPHIDSQGDFIPDDSMLKAAVDFAESSRVVKEMHQGEEVTKTVFLWPMTSEVAKTFGIETETTGLMIAIRPPEEMLEKFKSGEYTGFSIGGVRLEDEELEADG